MPGDMHLLRGPQYPAGSFISHALLLLTAQLYYVLVYQVLPTIAPFTSAVPSNKHLAAITW